MARVMVTGRGPFPQAALTVAKPEDEDDRATIDRSYRLGGRFHGVVALRVHEFKAKTLEAILKAEGWTFYRPPG